jgi:hypothetical protein
MSYLVKLILLVSLLINTVNINAQNTEVKFVLFLDNEKLKLVEDNSSSSELQVTKLRFYVSEMMFLEDRKIIAKE